MNRAPRARRSGAALVLVLLASLALATPATATVAGPAIDAPADDAFYDTPSAIARFAPGDVIRSEPLAAPEGARAWRVLYRSKATSGAPVAVSGVIVAPAQAASGRRPVVAWAHGTTGIADRCAPSRSPNVVGLIPYVDALLAAGYVVAATDYEGLGTEGVHPYLVGQSAGRSVLDAARAARRLDGVRAGRDVTVIGHSQGGQAALFAGELAKRYAPELAVDGVVAIAPVTDLTRILDTASRVPIVSAYAVMAAAGLAAAYPQAATDGLLTPEAQALVEVVDTGCAGDVQGAYAAVAGAYAVDPSAAPPYDELFAENTPGRARIRAPVLVAHGTADALIPLTLNQAFVPKLCAAGDVVELRAYEGASHGSVVTAAGPDILAWVAERRAGTAASSTCNAR